MKKFFLGVVVGISVTAAGSVYADEITSLVGKRIDGEFPVKISGKQLESKAAVLEGTSYLPVRAIGEALNMEVSFNAATGIELKPKGGLPVTQTNTTEESTTGPTDDILVDSTQPIEYQIKYLKDEISGLETEIPIMKFTFSTSHNKELEVAMLKAEKRLAAMKLLLDQLQLSHLETTK